MYKKILSLVLVLVMACSCFMVSVSADVLPEEEILKTRCKAELEEEYGIADISSEGNYISFAVKFDNYIVFQWRVGYPMSSFSFRYINGYWFDEGEILGNYTLDNYGNVEILEETARKGFIDMDELYAELPEDAEMHLSGDVDGDKEVTVKDATLVQKFVAKYSDVVTELVSDPVRIAAADVDHSGGFEDPDWVNNRDEVTIKDATYIQKKVARIFGEDDRQPFEYGEILVFIDGVDTHEYTLEDFPEYAFTGIEVKKLNALKLTMIKLKFEAEGEAGVIDAINSLKHREGTEFESVSPNGLFYPD